MTGRLDLTKAEALTREVRACFNRLKALGDRLHHDLRVTTAMRAVLETLHQGGDETVPRIARAKSVTRQHIQVIVNDLVEAGLVTTRANPTDQRSPLVAPTRAGRAVFERMRQREKAVLVELAQALPSTQIGSALATLEALHKFLDHKLHTGGTDD